MTTETVLGIRRVYLDSIERSSGTVSDYEINFSAVENVVAVELSGFAMPNSMMPTFITGFDDMVDFSVTRLELTKVFTIQWPSRNFKGEIRTRHLQVFNDFLSEFNDLLRNAISSDPDFGAGSASPVVLHVIADFYRHSHLAVESNARVTFLFATGPNAKQSAHKQLGFDSIDYEFIYQPVANLQPFFLVSPHLPLLQPHQQVEVIIDEIEIKPLAVIYSVPEPTMIKKKKVQFNNRLHAHAYTQSMNEVSPRCRFLRQSQPRRLSKFTVRIRVSGKPIETAFKNEHSLSFNVYHEMKTQEPTPSWFTQYIPI